MPECEPKRANRIAAGSAPPRANCGPKQNQARQPENRREALLVEAERIAHMGSYEWDVRTNSVYRSEELCRIFGVSLEEFKPTLDGYLERVHPQDRGRARAIIERAYQERIPFEFEERIVHPDGRVRELHSQGKWVLDAGQNPVKLIGICQDITERKFAEGLLSAEKHVLECIARRLPLAEVLAEICRRIEALNPPVMASIMLLDPDGKHIRPGAAPSLPERWVSAITIAPLGIGPIAGACGTAAFRRETVVAEDIAQDPLWTAYPSVLQIALDCGLRACWSTPIFSAKDELLGTFALYYTERRKPGPRDADLIGQVAHLASVAIEHDRALTALRQAHAELEQRVEERTAELVRANERLEEMDRLKSQFLATISHELRTPLNSVIGFAGILKQELAGPLNDEQQRQLSMVLGSGKHLLSLINDLLDLSRIEAGKVELESDTFDFVEVVDEVVQNLEPMARQKQLRLTNDLPRPTIEMVGDRKRCYQVLLNLTNNALKFTQQGEVKITAQPQGDCLRVSVLDTGIGIKPEQMGLLFEAFRQLDGAAKRVYEGTGLGLHLCRRLLRLMRGEISVQSEFGKGSCFSFILPRNLGSG